MCYSPVRVKNPYRGLKYLSYIHDTESAYINVPCGVCKQCIALRQLDIIQRVQMESLDSFLFFTTLTYDNEHLPKITTSTGYEIPFADINHLQLLFKRLRRGNYFGRPFRYFAVSERGSSEQGSARPHFHVLWFLPRFNGELYSDGLSLSKLLYDVIKEQWVINTGDNWHPVYEPLFTHKSKFYRGKLYSNYDTHFVSPSLTSDGIDSVAFYVSKYLLKQNPREKRLQQAFKLNLPEDEYEYLWPIVKSKSLRSSSFGFGFGDVPSDPSRGRFYKIVDYLRSCVARSDPKKGFPCYFPPSSVGSFPLSHFYKSNPLVYSLKDALDFLTEKDPFEVADFSLTDAVIAESKLDKVVNLVDSKDLSLNFSFLFDD